MIRNNFQFFILFFLFCLSGIFAAAEEEQLFQIEPDDGLQRFEFNEEKMAVPVKLIFYAESQKKANETAEAVFHRFDELNEMMSDYNPESEIVCACRESGESGESIPISGTLYDLLKRAREINELTDGAFDVSVSPIVKLWRRSRTFGKRPPEDYLERARDLVGNQNWELTKSEDGTTLGLRVLKKNVRLDLGGIAKGYAIDEGFRVFESLGVTSALIDAGGDLRVSSPPPGKEGWTVGGISLSQEEGAAYYISAANVAIASSGDTFQYFEIDGIRYSHIIDPRTCEPLTRHSVVSVLAQDAATADGLASALSVLGPEQGASLVKKLSDIEVMMLFDSLDPSSENPEVFSTGRFQSLQEDSQDKKDR